MGILGYHPRKPDPGKLTIFIKAWKRDSNYTGKLYDLLADKVDAFYNFCYHADEQPENFHGSISVVAYRYDTYNPGRPLS